MDERIIELGIPELIDEPQPPRRDEFASLRRIRPALLALVCLFVFGAAAGRPEAPLTLMGYVQWPTGALADRLFPTLAAGLVLAEVGDEVLAYHPNGTLAWRYRGATGPLEGLRTITFDTWSDSVLVVHASLSLGGEVLQPDMITTVALDPATGRERWRIPGRPLRIGDDLVMVIGGRTDDKGEWRIYRDLPDGLMWTVPPARSIATDPAADVLMTLTSEGLLTEYQMSTGTPRRTAWLTLPGLDPVDDLLTMQLYRDRLFLRATRFSGPEPDIKALTYDRATLRQLPPSPVDEFVDVEKCGPMVCGSTFERTHVLDPDSLTELWRSEPGEYVSGAVGGFMLLRSGSSRLVDARTGRAHFDAAGWIVVQNADRSLDEREAAVPLVTLQAGERAFVARLTYTSILVIGVVPGQLRTCQLSGDLLACSMDHDRTGIWRLTSH